VFAHGGLQLLQRVGKTVRRRGQPEFLGRQPADAFAVHRQAGGTGGWDAGGQTLALDLQQDLGGDGFDLGDDDVRPLGVDQPAKLAGVGHIDYVRSVRDLVARRVRIAVGGNHFHAQRLEREDHLLAQFAGAEQHHLERGRRERCSKQLCHHCERRPALPHIVIDIINIMRIYLCACDFSDFT
jgi:hypothetical protein